MDPKVQLALLLLVRCTKGLHPWCYGEDRETQQGRILSNWINEVPYLLLPDVISIGLGTSSPSHFERSIQGKSSWVEFPSEVSILLLTKDNMKNKLSFYQGINSPLHVIGKSIDMKSFFRCNSHHKYYQQLKVHLTFDAIFSRLLRERVIDGIYLRDQGWDVSTQNGMSLSEEEFNKQLDELQKLLFIKTVEIVYKRTGIFMGKDFFKQYVFGGLCIGYPSELSDEIWQTLSLTDEIYKRITAKEFTITDADQKLVSMVDNVEAMIMDIIAEAESAISAIL